MSKEDKHNIKASQGEKGKKLTHLQKFHDTCTYQWKFGYELAIFPDMNVLQSPGLKFILGIIGIKNIFYIGIV